MIDWINRVIAWVADLLGLEPTPLEIATSPEVVPMPPASIARKHMVFHAERLEGTAPEIRAFFAWWDLDGPFPLTIPSDGGRRTDEAHQHQLYVEGKTNAATLADTPHGRGGAADAYPAIVRTRADGAEYVAAIYQAADRFDLFEAMGRLAEAHGLTWGGRWQNLYGFGPQGDAAHVQVANWRDLPLLQRVA